jgi:hypothetical protein
MVEASGDFEDEGTLVLEQRFAIVPEWVIDAAISDSAYRLLFGAAPLRPDVGSPHARSGAARDPARRTASTGR